MKFSVKNWIHLQSLYKSPVPTENVCLFQTCQWCHWFVMHVMELPTALVLDTVNVFVGQKISRWKMICNTALNNIYLFTYFIAL